MSARRLRDIAPVATVAASLVLLLSGLLIGGHPDEEEYRNAISSTVLHARALLDGIYPYWTSDLGFGVPHPMTPALIFHPMVLLFGLLSPATAVAAIYVVHALVGASGAWWLVYDVSGDRWAAALGAATWALAAPSQNYVLTDFWPSLFVVWSLAPFMLLAALRVLDAQPGGQPWIPAIGLGLVSGLMWVNGHTGYVPVLFIPLAVMFAAHPAVLLRRWPAVLVSLITGALIAAPTLLQLFIEVERFPRVSRVSYTEAIGATHVWDLFFRPITLTTPSAMADAVLARGTRVPFLGGPMFVLALGYVLGLLSPRPYRRGVALGFASALLLIATPGLGRMGVLAATYLFRDGLVLFGLVLGALAWTALRARRPRLAAVVATLQVTVLWAATWPFVRAEMRGNVVARHAVSDTALTQKLRDVGLQYPGRWYLSPAIDELTMRQTLLQDGLWQNTWIYRGLPIVNGTFKGVSADPLYPSRVLPYGEIRSEAAAMNSAPFLTAMGISLVLAAPGEATAPELAEITRVSTHDAIGLRVLRHADPWPGAAFVTGGVVDATLDALPGCRAPGVLCGDFAPVVRGARTESIHVSRKHGQIRVEFTPDASQRWLLLSEMYRPGWHVSSNRKGAFVRAALGEQSPHGTPQGLVAVSVPPEARFVDLRFRPASRVAATWLAWMTIGCSAALLAVAGGGARRGPREYLAKLLARYVGYHLPEGSRVVEFAPRSPMLRNALQRPDIRVMAPGDSVDATSIATWDALRTYEPDRIVLNGTPHDDPDIQATLERLREASTADTRLVILYYNSLWRPLFALARGVGIARTPPRHNWVLAFRRRKPVANLRLRVDQSVTARARTVLRPRRERGSESLAGTAAGLPMVRRREPRARKTARHAARGAAVGLSRRGRKE
jgi:hypothetical protein